METEPDWLITDPWLIAIHRIKEILMGMTEDDRNDAIEALRSAFNTVYTREAGE